MTNNGYDITTLEKLSDLTCLLAQCLKKGVVFLEGDLGSGKTTFAQLFLHHLGYEGVVNSPSYALMNCYEVGNCAVIHADLYRLLEPEELLYLDVQDWTDMAEIILIEWAQQGQGFLPAPDLRCRFELSAVGRRLYLEPNSTKMQALLQQMMPLL